MTLSWRLLRLKKLGNDQVVSNVIVAIIGLAMHQRVRVSNFITRTACPSRFPS